MWPGATGPLFGCHSLSIWWQYVLLQEHEFEPLHSHVLGPHASRGCKLMQEATLLPQQTLEEGGEWSPASRCSKGYHIGQLGSLVERDNRRPGCM
jgi:hypothetical protein